MQQREGSVLPIVFRLKLLSLGECGDKDSIQGYFQDLCLLLSQEQNSIRECLSIYEKNIPNIKQQLAEAFVLKQDDGLIIFRRYGFFIYLGSFMIHCSIVRHFWMFCLNFIACLESRRIHLCTLRSCGTIIFLTWLIIWCSKSTLLYLSLMSNSTGLIQTIFLDS